MALVAQSLKVPRVILAAERVALPRDRHDVIDLKQARSAYR